MTNGFCDHDKLHLLGDSATRPIEPRCGTLAALLSQGTEALALARLKQSTGLFVSGLGLAGMSPQRRLPCRARLRLQAQAVSQAGSVLPEFPAPPLPAHRITAHSGSSNCRF